MMASFSLGIGNAILTSSVYSGLTGSLVCIRFTYALTSEAVQLQVQLSRGQSIKSVGTWTYDDQTNYPQFTNAEVTVNGGFDRVNFVATKLRFTMQQHFVSLDNVAVEPRPCAGGTGLYAIDRCNAMSN